MKKSSLTVFDMGNRWALLSMRRLSVTIFCWDKMLVIFVWLNWSTEGTTLHTQSHTSLLDVINSSVLDFKMYGVGGARSGNYSATDSANFCQKNITGAHNCNSSKSGDLHFGMKIFWDLPTIFWHPTIYKVLAPADFPWRSCF